MRLQNKPFYRLVLTGMDKQMHTNTKLVDLQKVFEFLGYGVFLEKSFFGFWTSVIK